MKTNIKKMISLMAATAVCISYATVVPVQAASTDDNASSVTAEFTAVTKTDITFKTSDNSAITSAEVYGSLENAMKGTSSVMQTTLSDADGDNKNDTISFTSPVGGGLAWGNEYYLRLATDTETDKYIYKKIKYNKIQNMDFENMAAGTYTLDAITDSDGNRVFEKSNENIFGVYRDDPWSPTLSLRNSYQNSYYPLTATKGVKNPIVEYEAFIAQIQPQYENSIKWNNLMGFVIGYDDSNIARSLTEAYKPGHSAYRNDWADHADEYAQGDWTSSDIGYVEAGLNDDGTMIIGARKDGTDNTQTTFSKTAKKDVTFDLDVSANSSLDPKVFKNFVFEMSQSSNNIMVRATQKKDEGNVSETVIKDMSGLKVKDNGYITICGSTPSGFYNGIAIDNILVYNYDDLQTELNEEYKIAISDDAQSSEIKEITSGNSKQVCFDLKAPAMVKNVVITDLRGAEVTSAAVTRENNSKSVTAVFVNPEKIAMDKAYKIKVSFVDGSESVSKQAFRLDKIFTEDFEDYNVGDKWQNDEFTPISEGGKDGTGKFYIGAYNTVYLAGDSKNKYLSHQAQYPVVITDESCKNLGNDFIVEADLGVNKFTSNNTGDHYYGMVGFGMGTPKFGSFQYPGYVDLTLDAGQWWCSAVGVVNMGMRQNDIGDNENEKGSLEINYWKNTDTVNELTSFANIKEFNAAANYGQKNTKVKDNWSVGQTYNMIAEKNGGTYSLQVRNGGDCYNAETSASDILYNSPESAQIAIYANCSTTTVDNIKVYRFKVLDSVLEWTPQLSGNTVNVNVTSMGQEAETAKVIVAWYTDKDEMVDCKTQTVNLNTISSIEPVAIPDGNKVVVYIWNDMENIKPLLPCEQLR